MIFFTNIIATLAVFLSPLFGGFGFLNQPQIISPTATRPVSVASHISTTTIIRGNAGATSKFTGIQSTSSADVSPNVCGGLAIIDEEGDPSNASKDATHVYGTDDEAGCDILEGAQPSTFIALNANYGEDKNGVWVMGGSTSGDTELPRVGKIVGADIATFSLIPDPDGFEGYSSEYTKDKEHVYADGIILIEADPVTFVASEIEKTFKDASSSETCLTDGHDANSYYMFGELVPDYCLIPSPIDQYLCAQSRIPMEMMRHG
jgi:hypothetical protein